MYCKIVKALRYFDTVMVIFAAIGNEPFYASDFNLSGSVINAMANRGFIQHTGVTKEIFIHIPTYNDDNLYKKVEIKQWQINIENCAAYKKDVANMIAQLADFIDGFKLD